jgi:glycosyltransferase involved in cell wall biosynthesis
VTQLPGARLSASADGKTVIAYDTWTLGAEHRNTGIHVYAREILVHLREIAEQHGVDVRPFVCNDNDAADLAPASGFTPVRSVLLRHGRMWRYGGGWLAMQRLKPDVIFSPSITTLQFASHAARVTTIHDVTPVVMPNFAPEKMLRKMRSFLSRAVRGSDHLIAISEFSKRDLMRVYEVPESRISVIYSGYDKRIFNTEPPAPDLRERLRQKYGLNKPYIVHHGLMQPRKNIKRLVQAYRLLLERNREFELDLVLAGPLGWGGEEIRREASEFTGRGRVILTGALGHEELATIVKCATLAAIPSLYEGFCLPLLESMACGVPTIAAETSCLPEISGGVLRYFDPKSVEELAACIESVIGNEALRSELSSRGVARAQQFDWQRSAAQTLQVLLTSAKAVS